MELLSKLRQALYSQELKEKHRKRAQDFTRDRKLPFFMVVLLIVNSIKGSLMDELDQFFQAVFRWDVAKRFVTPSALSQARRKLCHEVFLDLLDIVCRAVNRQTNLLTYQGLRVFAIDGSTMRLPNNQQVKDHFGVTRNNHGERAMGRVSLLHDVLNRITYDAILGHFNTGEITMAWQHFEVSPIPKNSLILMDRGYYDFTSLRNIIDSGHHFCIRLRSNLGIYRQFTQSGLEDMCLTLKPPKINRKAISPDSTLRQSFPVRIVRFRTGGDDYVLMTTFLNSSQYPISDLGDLYHARWQVEESFKLKKCQAHIEHISGATSEVVLQDFHARVLKESLTTSMLLDVNDHIQESTQARKYKYKSCLTQALAKMKNSLVLLFLRENPTPLIHDLLDVFSRSLVSVEPGRCYQRHLPHKFGSKTLSYSFGYRPNR